MKRQHPASLISYTSKNFWLLLIPLIRGLAYLKFDLAHWAEGAEWDILIVAVMIASAVLRWYFTEYEITDEGIMFRHGVFVHRESFVKYENVCAVTTEENPYYRTLGMVRAYIDTDAASGGRKSADISILISRSERARLFNIMSEKLSDGKKGVNFVYKTSAFALVMFSLLFSSAVSGTVLLITLLSGGAKIIGEKLESDFTNAVNTLSESVATLAGRLIRGISPAGIAISIVIGIGFLLSFLLNIFRHINFTAKRKGKCIVISAGFVTKRSCCINSSKINIADMRQNLLMKLFGITSVHVNCTGYGKRKNEIPVFVPISSKRSLFGGRISDESSGAIDMLLPGFPRCKDYISPSLWYAWRFLWPPALLIFAVLLAGFLGIVYFPHWHSLTAFLTVMAEIPAVWLLFVKACAYYTNGLNICGGSICAKYDKGYEFHSVTVPLERVAEIRICQSVFQRMNGSCDVVIYTASEYIGSHRVRSLPLNEVRELIKLGDVKIS